MAGIYNGHLLEFPQIRVDCFTSPNPLHPAWRIPLPFEPSLTPTSISSSASSKLFTQIAPAAQLFLLTHVHSDHLTGLGNDFTGRIICSLDTKRMLLRLEAEDPRLKLEGGIKESISRKYSALKAKIIDKGSRNERVVDLIEALPFGFPKEYILGYDDHGRPIKVTITLLDANHCPGSTMFLITSPEKAVLHTGDIRCDKLFMRSLLRNPAIQEFIVPTSEFSNGIIRPEGRSDLIKGAVMEIKKKGDQDDRGRLGSGRRVLDRIYLDTSAVLGTGDMPDKEEAIQDLLQQMSLYPDDNIFFLNVWCFGWEDVVKEVARYFDTQVHVDRYKSTIYSAVKSDPFLSACTTTDPHATRFHACERRAKCEACRSFNEHGDRVWNKDKRIVHVVMVEVKLAAWVSERAEFLDKLGKAASGVGDWPYNIQCPIARHSPLPELQSLVRLFRPHAVSPSTVVTQAQGLDYFLLPEFLADHIQPGAYDRMILERDTYFDDKMGKAYLKNLKALQAAGKSPDKPVLSDREEELRAERNDYLPDPALGAGRKSFAKDQLQRAGGISSADVDALMGGSSNVPGGQYGGYDGDGDGYSTDDEPGRRRKRRRPSTPFSLADEESMKMELAEEVERTENGLTTGANEVPETSKNKAVSGIVPEVVGGKSEAGMAAGRKKDSPSKEESITRPIPSPETKLSSIPTTSISIPAPHQSILSSKSRHPITQIKSELSPDPRIKLEENTPRRKIGTPRISGTPKIFVNQGHLKAMALAMAGGVKKEENL